MKTKVLFSALAVASLFAACNNEDMLTNEENKQFENAELLGKGLSLNLTNDAVGTRVENGNWETGDKAGLAWVVKGGNADSQGDITGVIDEPWANHMYTNKCGGDEWTTSSNIYKGWHFAYYPFAYQDAPKQLVFDVNAAPMKDKYLNDQYEALHISAADYLDASKIDGNAGTITTAFRMERVVNILKPILNIDKAFTENPELKDIKITGIDIYSSVPVFQNRLKVVPSKLPTFVYDAKTKEVDKAAINAKFTDALIFGATGALQVDGEATQHIVTTIDKAIADNYKLDGQKELRAFVAPVKAGANINGLVIRVNVEGGYFDVALSDKVDANKNAIKKLYSLLSGTKDEVNNENERNFQGVFYNAGTTEEPAMTPQPAQKLDLTLNKDNFHPDFSNIYDIDTWNGAVKMANALALDDVTFNLTGAVEFPEGDMNVPNAEKFQVKSEKSNGSMKFTKETNWNEKINGNMPGVTINVAEGAELNINSTLDFALVYNNGIINAGKNAKLGVSGQGYIHNNNRIIVEYGAFVYTAQPAGVIAYNVTNTAAEEISRINTLMKSAGNTKGHANVNTLIVSTTLDINAPASAIGGSDDPYNGTSATLESLGDLSNINIELADGTVVYDAETAKKAVVANTTVKSITAVSGNNTTTDVKTASITTNNGAVLTVTSATEPMTGLTMAGNITNNGTLNAKTNITCAEVYNKVGTINVDAEKVIWYTTTNGYTQGGTAHGLVLPKAAGLSESAKVVKDAWTDLIDETGWTVAENSTYSAYVTKLNTINPWQEGQIVKTLGEALNQWLTENGYTGVKAGNFSVDKLKMFENYVKTIEPDFSLGLTD